MANSLPFDAMSVNGEYDRVYKAEDWAWYFATFIANGIFPKPSDGLQVIAYNGMTVRVNAGYAFINGYAFRNPEIFSTTLDMADGARNRIDRIVVRWDLTQRDIYIDILAGIPSANPTAKAITRNAEIWELVLADIYIGKGVTKIQTQNITDQRFNSALCGIVTGTVEEIDASVLTKQFTDFFHTYSQSVIDEFGIYKNKIEMKWSDYCIIYNNYVSRTLSLFSEYENNCNDKYNAFDEDINSKQTQLLEAYNSFMNNIRSFQTEAENDFNTWFETVKDKLGKSNVTVSLKEYKSDSTEVVINNSASNYARFDFPQVYGAFSFIAIGIDFNSFSYSIMESVDVLNNGSDCRFELNTTSENDYDKLTVLLRGYIDPGSINRTWLEVEPIGKDGEYVYITSITLIKG